eukprot:1194591-Prorocentrum_minimum.AAC.2
MLLLYARQIEGFHPWVVGQPDPTPQRRAKSSGQTQAGVYVPTCDAAGARLETSSTLSPVASSAASPVPSAVTLVKPALERESSVAKLVIEPLLFRRFGFSLRTRAAARTTRITSHLNIRQYTKRWIY